MDSCFARLRSLARVFSRSLGLDDTQSAQRKKHDGEPRYEEVDPQLEAKFHEAARYALSLKGLSVSTRLSLYALFKQGTVGDAPSSSSGNLLDPAARSKWKAWSRMAGLPRADAMHQYMQSVAVARSGGGDEATQDDAAAEAELDAIDSMMRGMAGPVMSSLAGPEPEPEINAIALHAAAKAGDVALCEALVARGADVDQLDEDGHSALHWACDSGHVAVARCLIEAGASPNVQNVDGLTPLHMACACEHADLAKLLIAIGADTTLRDLDGCTAVELAPPNIVSMINGTRAGNF